MDETLCGHCGGEGGTLMGEVTCPVCDGTGRMMTPPETGTPRAAVLAFLAREDVLDAIRAACIKDTYEVLIKYLKKVAES